MTGIAEVEFCQLSDYKINGCLGCSACQKVFDKPGCEKRESKSWKMQQKHLRGKYIAFVCNDSIVSMILVNEKISSEFVYVTNSDEELLLKILLSAKL